MKLGFEYAVFSCLATVLVLLLCVRRRYSIVHVHNPPDFLVVAGLLPRLLGTKLVFDVHDLTPDMFSMRFPGSRAERVLRAVERTAIHFSDATLTVHDPYRRELIARGADPTKVTVVMNSLDESLLPPPEPTGTDPFRIVYHGTVTPAYGVELVVEALPALCAHTSAEVRLEVYGEGDSLVALAERARELGVADAVRIKGTYLDHREVLRRVNGAAVGVIPNRAIALNRFALSSKLFEYVLLGIPVVSARLPTIYEYFGDTLSYFEPDQPDSLAMALVDVQSDPEGARRRAAAAREQYEPLRWPLSAGRYRSVLESLTDA